ncbi:glutamine synthetase family protein (plasmid) [Rhizobium ruizarguesonis]|uniref:Glutamine synthetase n=2 Tax=Rhizobium TaxID=379 RepID=A0A179C0G0_RHILE|nr:glutamine synthetase [Rhizobium leguminosarum]OAP97639.1 glutamine synthetase [Rhizobium leguminosarum]
MEFPEIGLDLKQFLRDDAYKHVKIGAFDLDGVLRGKYMAREKFISSLEDGFGFCDVIFGWDSNDQLYDNTDRIGWNSGYGDAQVRLLPETARKLPLESDTLFVLGEFVGQLEELCPRGVLKRVLRKAMAMGLRPKAACEFEFLVVEENARTLADKNYRNLRPLGFGGFGYSVIRNSVNSEFYHGILDLFEAMRIPLEGLHEETGPGAMEAAIGVDDALAAADKGALFKTFAKVFAQKNGLMASFMAKWDSSLPGQGGHVHVSLVDENGVGVFHDHSTEHGISRTMRNFIGGLQKLAPSIAVLTAPTVNSYRRLVPGHWAPTAATWGIDNRTVAIRAITGSLKSQRVEFRIPGADANPYLTLAATLGAGLWGIENKVEPEAALSGNAYQITAPTRQQLPRTLSEAADNFRNSAIAHEIFGSAFVEHYAATRDWEHRQFQHHVSDWELSRYFEII